MTKFLTILTTISTIIATYQTLDKGIQESNEMKIIKAYEKLIERCD